VGEIKGYVKPLYSKFLFEEGHWQHGYLPEDFAKIVAGYACGQCGEDYNGLYLQRCPVCGFENMGGGDPPPEWRDRK
jgi:hypothetical protein